MGGNVFAVETNQRERIGRVIDRRGDEGVHALANEAGVGAENKHDRRRLAETGKKGVDVRGFDRGHCGGVHVPATKYEASLFLMVSATT